MRMSMMDILSDVLSTDLRAVWSLGGSRHTSLRTQCHRIHRERTVLLVSYSAVDTVVHCYSQVY